MDLVAFINCDGIKPYDQLNYSTAMANSAGLPFMIQSFLFISIVDKDCKMLDRIQIMTNKFILNDGLEISTTDTNYDILVINKIVGYLR